MYFNISENGFVCLESELYLDQFFGFTLTGVVMPPAKVHPDSLCGKFVVRVMNIVSQYHRLQLLTYCQ